jgi:hypothetical protein
LTDSICFPLKNPSAGRTPDPDRKQTCGMDANKKSSTVVFTERSMCNCMVDIFMHNVGQQPTARPSKHLVPFGVHERVEKLWNACLTVDASE